jgi:hypothetical protein
VFTVQCVKLGGGVAHPLIGRYNAGDSVDKYQQLENLIRQELIGFGCKKLVTYDKLEKLDRRDERFKLTPHYHLNELMIYFYSVLTRLVLPCKRDVIIYDGFDNKVQDTGLERLYEKVKEGHNLIPHLSKLVFELDQGRLNDPMLAEWGIYHFHIPDNDGNKFFVNRTNQLLFAIVTQTEFIPLDIQPHDNELGTYEPWVDVDIFEKLERYYPQAIQHFKQREDVQPLTFEQRRALRTKNGNTNVITNSGNEYVPPSFGSTASGHPMSVITKVYHNMLLLKHDLNDIDEIVFDANYNLIARNAL